MERLANASSRDGRMAPSASSKKDLGVVTSLVPAKRERASFFRRDGSFFSHASSPFLSGASGSFCIFAFIFINSYIYTGYLIHDNYFLDAPTNDVYFLIQPIEFLLRIQRAILWLK